ncbi:protein STRUBBELIG-like isoform X2 [Durio zibethinus]|uniref:Protein STRUBBELIG-like isoform X2 n=1 Tax=Durio zibethinus TaxID=66656 RepID=A0A6P5WJX3_DURZI|nr:protein STRUBBELIG-like isoform X2 [Durio zibethinus]
MGEPDIFFVDCDYDDDKTSADYYFDSDSHFVINSLYTSLVSPPLLGWILVGRDPCGEEWQGVSYVFSNITKLYMDFLSFL